MEIGCFTQIELIKKCWEKATLERWDKLQDLYSYEVNSDEEFKQREQSLGVVDPMKKNDHSFIECSSTEQILEKLTQDRQGIIFKDLAFVRQDSEDNWWVLKKWPDGRLIHFDDFSLNGEVESGKDTSEQRFSDIITKYSKGECSYDLEIGHAEIFFKSVSEGMERDTHLDEIGDEIGNKIGNEIRDELIDKIIDKLYDEECDYEL